MSQSRTMFLVEVSTNTTAGVLLSLAMQGLLFPAVGLQASFSQNLALALGFTILSALRGYALRRLFVRLGNSRYPGGAVRLSRKALPRPTGPLVADTATIPTGGRLPRRLEEAG